MEQGSLPNIESAILSVAKALLNQGFTNPAGSLIPYAGSSTVIPDGWLLCDGTAISRTTYSTLYSIIGTTYGVGDGSTTFNLPNTKGRTIVALNSSDTEFDSLGETGGSKTHTLTTAEIPSHSHGVAARWWATAGVTDANGVSYANSAAGGGGTFTSGTAGSGGSHNNLQPYITMHYIIKT